MTGWIAMVLKRPSRNIRRVVLSSIFLLLAVGLPIGMRQEVSAATIRPQDSDVWIRFFDEPEDSTLDPPWLHQEINGDIIVYYHNWDIRKFRYFSFFDYQGTHASNLSSIENNLLPKAANRPLQSDTVDLADGSKLIIEYLPPSSFDMTFEPPGCASPHSRAIAHVGPTTTRTPAHPGGQVLARKIVMYLQDAATPNQRGTKCPVWHQNFDHKMVGQTRSSLMQMALLPDQTVIAVSTFDALVLPFAIRFRADFSGPQHSSIRIVDSSVVTDAKDRFIRAYLRRVSRKESLSVEEKLDALREFDADLYAMLKAMR